MSNRSTPTNVAMAQAITDMARMVTTRIRRVGTIGLKESRIEIIVRLPPYWFSDMIDNAPSSSAIITTRPQPGKRLSAASRKAVIGSAPGIAADITAPRMNTQTPEIRLGRYVHQNVLRTELFAGRYRE